MQDTLAWMQNPSGGRRFRDFRLQQSFRWGCVSCLYKRPSRAGRPATLQCNCPRRSHMTHHPNGSMTRCTLSLSFSTGEEKEQVIQRMKWWVSQAGAHASRRSHGKFRPALSDIPDDLEAHRPPSDREVTDVEAEAQRPPKRRCVKRGSRLIASMRQVVDRNLAERQPVASADVQPNSGDSSGPSSAEDASSEPVSSTEVT